MSVLGLCSYATGEDLKDNSVSPTNKPSITNEPGSALKSPSDIKASSTATAIDSNPQVLEAFNPDGGDLKNHFRLGSILIVKVDKPKELLKQEGDKKKNSILYINNVPIKGLSRTSIDTLNGELRFIITRDNDTKSSWDQLVCRPHLQMQTKAAVTVGFDDDTSFTTKVTGTKAMTFDIINSWGFILWIIFTAGLALLVIYMGSKTPLLRCAGMNSSYSLAYSQMAFWTFFVCSGYVLIYLITLEMPNLNSSMLILMGLSAGTALSGKVIDSNKPVPKASGNYLKDILQDVDGYTVARLQIFIWTLITGAIFISNIYNNLAMPEFGVPLLTLMGISSGTYLGFKIPETKTPQSASQAAADAAAKRPSITAPNPSDNAQNDKQQAMG
jgi:hypothetical protein